MDMTPLDESILMAEVNAEIARATAAVHSRELVLSPAQLAALVAMRNAGMTWPAIGAFFKRKGWSGSQHTLRRIYREATGDA